MKRNKGVRPSQICQMLRPDPSHADKAIFAVLCLTIFLMPLPYGSVEEWSVFIFEAVTFVLFALHLILEFRKKKGTGADSGSPRPKSFSILCALLAVFFLFTISQIVPRPAALVKTISPQTFDIYQKSAPAHSPDSAPIADNPNVSSSVPAALTLSLAANLTVSELLKYLAYLLFAVLLFRHLRTPRDVEILIWTLLIAALFQSIYGISELFGGTGRIFSWKNVHYHGSAFGTFVNRDHFSGYLEMIFPLSVGYLLAKAHFFSLPPGLSLKEKIVRFGEERLQKTFILAIFPFFIGLGIVFSRCRTGVFIFLLTIFVMSVFSSQRFVRQSSPHSHPTDYSRPSSPHSGGSSWLIRLVFLIIIFAAVFIGLNPLISRFTENSLAFEFEKGRPFVYRNTVDLIASFGLVGSGPGTFVFAYPIAEKSGRSGLLDHAHNDYLEILAESGIVAGGALILCAFLAFAVLFARWLRRHDAFVRGIGLGALIGILALFVHSLLDFNLRIPANALLFVSLYALAFRVLSFKRPKLRTLIDTTKFLAP